MNWNLGVNTMARGHTHARAGTHTRAHTDTCKHLGGGLSQNATCHRPRIAVTSPLNNKNHLQRQTEGGGVGLQAGGPAGQDGKHQNTSINQRPTWSRALAAETQRRATLERVSVDYTNTRPRAKRHTFVPRPALRVCGHLEGVFFFFCGGRGRREPLMAKRCCVADFGACSPWLTSFFFITASLQNTSCFCAGVWKLGCCSVG